MAETQNYSNHTRWYPLFHFILAPLLLVNIIYQSMRLYQEPSWDRTVWLGLALVLGLVNFAARVQALKAQDRVIRLEEKLRYREVLTPDMVGRSGGLDNGQIIALRFAPDEELSALVERTLNGEFAKNKEIKMAIKNWRGDHHRV